MTDMVFNIGKGAGAEVFRTAATSGGILLLQDQADTDAALKDHDTVSALTSANSEADFTNYTQKVGITGTITVDDTNDRVDVDFPDQTWSSAGNGANNTLVGAVFFHNTVPLTHQDFTPTTDGSDLTIQLNASGFYRAA